MKKIFSTLALLGLASSLTFAQKNVDLELVSFDEPAMNSQVPNLASGESIQFVVTVVNNGPDVVAADDTLFLAFQGTGIATDGTNDYTLFAPAFTGQAIAVGESVQLAMEFTQGDNYGDAGNGPVITNFPQNAEDTIYTWVYGKDLYGGFFDDAGVSPNQSGSMMAPDDASSNNVGATVFTFGNPNDSTGIKDIDNSKNALVVYPNPANTSISVKYNFEQAATASVRVMDIFGRTVINNALGFQTVGEKEFNVNLNGLAQGLYTIEISTENGRATNRFSIVK